MHVLRDPLGGSFDGSFSSGPGKALEKKLHGAPEDRVYVSITPHLEQLQFFCKVLVVSQG